MGKKKKKLSNKERKRDKGKRGGMKREMGKDRGVLQLKPVCFCIQSNEGNVLTEFIEAKSKNLT